MKNKPKQFCKKLKGKEIKEKTGQKKNKKRPKIGTPLGYPSPASQGSK